MSPFLCNSLWGFQSVEGALRTLYPARRLEREWNIRREVAEHIELPSLPWGVASLLTGSGVRWVSNPFLDYDCTFKGLKNPPLFRWAGPDGSEVRVVMDAWACSRAHYAQGALLLREPTRIAKDWLPHYQQLGTADPLFTMLASGPHSDISPESWKQTRGFSEALAGAMFILGTGERFQLLGRMEICQPCVASPAFQPGRIYVRGQQDLFCLGTP